MFSQIFKSLLLNHVMRLAIVVVCLSYSAAAAAAGSWTPTWKPKADFCTGSTGCGLVYVSTTSSTPTAEQWQSSAHQPTITAAAISNTDILATSAKTIYWHAKANDGYYFGGWYKEANANTLQSSSNKYSQKIELNIAKQNDRTTYYAKFKNLSDLTITMVAPIEGSSYTVTPTGKGAYTIETQNVDFTYEGGFFTKESHLKMTFKIKKYPANQRLYAWRITENGKTVDYRVSYDVNKTEAQNIANSSYTYTFTASATVEPIFVHNRHATYVVGNDAEDFLDESNYYVNLQQALDDAVTHSSHRVTVMATGELDTSEQSEYTVPAGVTLVVPGEQTYRYRVGAITKQDIIEGAGATLKEFVTFTMPSDAVLNVKGNLSVYAVLNSDGKGLQNYEYYDSNDNRLFNNYNGDLDLASGLLLLFAFAITGGSIIGSFPLSIVNISMALKNIFIRKEEKLSFNLLIIITNTLIIITTISVFIYFEFIAA